MRAKALAMSPPTSAMYLEIREEAPRTETTTRSADGRTRRRARARARDSYGERAAPPEGRRSAEERRQPVERARLHKRQRHPWAYLGSAEHPTHCHQDAPHHLHARPSLQQSRTSPAAPSRWIQPWSPLPYSTHTSPPRLPRPRRSGAQRARVARRRIGNGVSYGEIYKQTPHRATPCATTHTQPNPHQERVWQGKCLHRIPSLFPYRGTETN